MGSLVDGNWKMIVLDDFNFMNRNGEQIQIHKKNIHDQSMLNVLTLFNIFQEKDQTVK